jgi:hypothetical protein
MRSLHAGSDLAYRRLVRTVETTSPPALLTPHLIETDHWPSNILHQRVYSSCVHALATIIRTHGFRLVS